MKVMAFSLVFFDNKFSQKFNLDFGRKIFLKNFFDFLIFLLLLLPLTFAKSQILSQNLPGLFTDHL